MATPSTSTAMEPQLGLTYATHDGVALQGDLYAPRGAGPFPALIAVHGGGWKYGARGLFQHWGPYLAARGHALFAISFRCAKVGQSSFPHAIQDVLAAVQFVRANAAQLGIAPERIGLMGASSGAHLAALAALGGRSRTFAGGYPDDPHANVSSEVKALVSVYGVFELLNLWQCTRLESPSENLVETFLGTSPMKDRQIYFDASPLSYATVASNEVSVLLCTGTEDDAVDRAAQHDTFLLALKQADFFVRTCIVQGAPHFWLNDPINDEPGSYTSFFAPRLLRFLAERL
jgi:acetyl esterase/lipase